LPQGHNYYFLVIPFILVFSINASFARETGEITTDRIIVKFKPGRQIKAAAVKAKAMKNMRRVYTVPVGEGKDIKEVMKAYRNRPDVELVQPDYKRRAFALSGTTDLPENWGIARTGADKLNKRVSGSGVVVVAVVDTGVDASHPLLTGKVLAGYDFVNGDNYAGDDSNLGHGTFVAGIIAMVAGELPVRILPVKVLNADGVGYDSDIADAIYYSVDKGADVINLSLGGPGYSPVLEEAVNYAVRNGVVVTAAAGNDSSDAGNYSPAGIQSCITVSAVNRDDIITGFSNFGDVVDIAAPGKSIVSSVPLNVDPDGIRDGYASYDGTSAAASFVAGIGALLRIQNESFTVEQVEDLICQYVDDVGYPGWDIYYGHGIVNFADYVIDQPLNVEIVSPQPGTEHFGTLEVNCNLTEVFTGAVVFKVDGELLEREKAISQESLSVNLDIMALAEGEHVLSVELTDGKGEVRALDQVIFVVRRSSEGLKNLFREYIILGSMRNGTPLDHTFTVRFSMAVDASTVTPENLLLYQYDIVEQIPVCIEAVDDKTFKMIPLAPLDPCSEYWVVVKPSIKSRSGFWLKEGVVAKFKTVE